MTNAEPTFVCASANCNQPKPLSEYVIKDGKRIPYCLTCIRRRRQQRDSRRRIADGMRDDWDWAMAFSKSLKAKAHIRGEAVENVDGELLRCLFQLQRGRCALSGLELLTPGIGPSNTGVEKWRNHLPAHQVGLSIDAIRLSAGDDWMPGNILLVCHMFAQIYSYAQSIDAFKQLCAAPLDIRVVVYDHSTISLVRDQRRAARLGAMIKKEEIPW